MAIGSISLFLSNILLKEYLTVNEYFEYSIIITLLALLNSFGAFGVEQTFLRLSKVKNRGEIIIDFKIIPLAILAIFISSIILLYYCNEFISVSSSRLSIFTLFLGINVSMLKYNILRISSNFVLAQIIQNIWRISLMVFVAFVGLYKLSFSWFVGSLNFTVWLSILIILLLTRKCFSIKPSFANNKNDVLKYTFHFFICLLSISFISQGDRLIIEALFDKEDFGNYFYLCTLFLFPFSFLQNYIGFKEIVKMKTSIIKFRPLLLRVGIGSLIFSILLACSIYMLVKINLVSINIYQSNFYVAVLMIIGNIKLFYSIFSAFIGAKAEVNEIRNMNYLFIFSCVILFFCFKHVITTSVLMTLVLFSLLWFIRLVIWAYYCFKTIRVRSND